MTATAKPVSENRDVLRMKPGAHPVVSCYLKIEPRDRARNKYLTKVRNRVKELEYSLHSLGWERQAEDAVRGDLARIVDFLRDPTRLPPTQGLAIFASKPLGLFEVRPLPRVHRSRLAVDRTPLVRELAASEEEFGKIFTVTLDRSHALIWEVTAYDAKVVRKVETAVTRGGRYHSPAARNNATGEHTFHNRIRDERRRHLENVSRALFEVDRQSPGHQIVIAGAGSDANNIEPFLHNYVADRLIGMAKLAPKDATPAAVHALTMEVRSEYVRASESRHIAELREGLGTGWAVNGVRETLNAMSQGQVRTLLVRGDATVTGFRSLKSGRLSPLARDLREDGEVRPTVDLIDDAIEEALRQRVGLDVIYEPELGEKIDGLAGLLRFK